MTRLRRSGRLAVSVQCNEQTPEAVPTKHLAGSGPNSSRRSLSQGQLKLKLSRMVASNLQHSTRRGGANSFSFSIGNSPNSSFSKRAEQRARLGTGQMSAALPERTRQLAPDRPRAIPGKRTNVGTNSSVWPQQNAMDLIKSSSRTHFWHWNCNDKSPQCVVSNNKLEVCFHPECSESAAAIRGSQPLIRNGNYYYWEITVQDKIYGTSVMFGLCTKQQRLHANDYCNLIGLDEHGWSLSHKGHIWHDGNNSKYTQMFPTNQTVTIGLLFNTLRGELSYFMNGKNLGVAFCGLNNVESDLYPVIGSTAKCTRMRLDGAYCGYVSLLERSCFTLLNNAPDKSKLVDKLRKQSQVPQILINYLAETAKVCDSQTKITVQLDHYNLTVGHQRMSPHGDSNMEMSF